MVPRLPIPNRVVKRTSADDSADTRAKVGHCQTPIDDTRLMAGVVLCGVEGREIGKRKRNEKNEWVERAEKKIG